MYIIFGDDIYMLILSYNCRLSCPDISRFPFNDKYKSLEICGWYREVKLEINQDSAVLSSRCALLLLYLTAARDRRRCSSRLYGCGDNSFLDFDVKLPYLLS